MFHSGPCLGVTFEGRDHHLLTSTPHFTGKTVTPPASRGCCSPSLRRVPRGLPGQRQL